MRTRWRCRYQGTLFAAAALAAGCAGGPGKQNDLEPHTQAVAPLAAGGPSRAPDAGPARTPTADAERSGSEADLYAEAPRSLADIARRDVEALLAGASAPLFRAGGAAEPVAYVPADPLAIEWVVPAAAPVALAQREPAIPATPPPARKEDESFVPGPLFRREDGLSVDGVPDLVPADDEDEGQDEQDASASPALERDRVGELLVELSRELYVESSYADMPMRELLAIAAQSIVRPERTLETAALPGLAGREREVLDRFQAFCRRLGEGLDGGRDASEIVTEAVNELRSGLLEQRLAIRTQALCWRIDGFGAYDAFDRNTFLAHADQKVILYLEIDGFASERNERGEWVTELSQQLVIYSEHEGLPVWTADWQPAVDASQNRRRDFFTVQVLTLPKALSVGRYRLKVSVRDERSGAETETSVPFEMVADEKLAARVP